MPMSSDVKELLAQADWQEEARRGIAHARKLELKYGSLVPVSIAEDMVMDAITKTLKGERVWDPNVVGLRRFLFQTIRSLYSNEIRKLQDRLSVEYDDERGFSETPSPEEAVMMKSQLGQVIGQLRERKPDLYDFLCRCERYGLFDENRDHKDIAADMQMSASQFSKAKKRLAKFSTELHVELSSLGPKDRLERGKK